MKLQDQPHFTTQVGVVIGRFQVNEIHTGHVKLLRHVQDKHPSMLVLLGCRHAPQDRQNPLEFAPRAQMMQAVCPNAVVLPIWDCETDEEWSTNVDNLIQGTFPTRKAVLYGGRNSFIEHYTGSFSTANMDFYESTSGTSIRERISSFPENNSSFRAGIIFGLTNLQPRLFTTVDIAVIKYTPVTVDKVIKGVSYPTIEHHPEILLGRRELNKKRRLPGGFIDLTDKSAEQAALRELKEETGLLALEMNYYTSMKIDDWRSRGAKDVGHMTMLFVVTEFEGEPKGGDDLPEVDWFPLTSETLSEVVHEHVPLLRSLDDRTQ